MALSEFVIDNFSNRSENLTLSHDLLFDNELLSSLMLFLLLILILFEKPKKLVLEVAGSDPVSLGFLVRSNLADDDSLLELSQPISFQV